MPTTFFETVTEAVADLTENGYDSEERLRYWTETLRHAAFAAMVPEAVLDEQLRRILKGAYERLIEQGSILRTHRGVDRFTLARVKPKLRAELDRRILASANLIKLNREQTIADTLRRFQGWATSIPVGGTAITDRAGTKNNIRSELATQSFRERRVLIDQGHKLNAALSDILASDGGAIAARWHSHWKQLHYDYRPEHKDRDKLVYAVRGNWALKGGLMKAGEAGYTDEITRPGEEVYCRCLGPSSRIFHASDIEMISRRDYNGPVLEIVTSAAPKLPLVLTPNHPVLTGRGWSATQGLDVADDLVELCQEDIPSGSGINDENSRAPMISEIFEAAAKTWGVRTVRDSRVQFHGDGSADGCVEIVRPARKLSFGVESFGDQGADQFLLPEPDRNGLRSGSVYSVFERLLTAAHGGSGVCEVAHSLLAFLFGQAGPIHLLAGADFGGDGYPFGVGPLSGFEKRGICVRSDVYSGVPQAAADSRIGDIELLCKSHRIPTAKIRLSKILSIKRKAFSGHVYNLQTADEWYSAGRIISHNCYYNYIYNLRDLPAAMWTEKGRRQLASMGFRAA